MSTELKPCAHCGGTPELNDHRTVWVVACNCGASVVGDQAPEPDEEKGDEYWNGIMQTAIDRWNRRAQPKAEPADPMDWPLPCDVKVGSGTNKKGTKLRTLVARMNTLHAMAMVKAAPAEPVAVPDGHILCGPSLVRYGAGVFNTKQAQAAVALTELLTTDAAPVATAGQAPAPTNPSTD